MNLMNLNSKHIFPATVTVVLLLAFAMVGWPIYSVWRAEKTGMAELRKAEQNRQIRVEEARAQMEAAEMLADAEIARAHGVAEANRIVADGLGGPEGYLRYLFIQGLQNAAEMGGQVIYIPTEATMPVLEAGRFSLGSN